MFVDAADNGLVALPVVQSVAFRTYISGAYWVIAAGSYKSVIGIASHGRSRSRVVLECNVCHGCVKKLR